MAERSVSRGRGFTILEVCIVLVLVVIAVFFFLPMFGSQPRATTGRTLMDSSQIRGIHQSMIQWAMQNNEQFPLPSEIDVDGNTVDVGQSDDPSRAFMLDSTRNIFSMLVFNGSVPVYMFVSPSEVGLIVQYDYYQVSEPSEAVDPRRALWDPAFRATPRDSALGEQREGDEGSFSYAHTMPFGRRREDVWRDTFDASQAVFGNRGASWSQTPGGGWALLDDSHGIADDYSAPVGTESFTLLIHGSRVKWEGNIAYQDNRVVHEYQPDPADLPFAFTNVGTRADNVFSNENDTTGVPDDESRVDAQSDNVNAFLRSYSDRISGGVLDDEGKGVLDVRLEIFYD